MKKEIQEYLTKKFQQEGFARFPVNKITADLKISKKTIYKIFKSKHELIDLIILGMLNRAYVDVIQITASETTFIEKFHAVFDIVKKNLKAFDDTSLKELKKEYPDIWLKVARFRKHNIIPLLTLLITTGIKKEVLHNYPVDLYLKLIYGAITELTKRNSNSIEEEHDLLLNIILNGALTKKGKKFFKQQLINDH